jgi:hypothetical protein
MDIAAQVMKHPQFRRVRDALRVKLQFRDGLYRDEIERIASSVTTPNAVSLQVEEPRAEGATSAGVL